MNDFPQPCSHQWERTKDDETMVQDTCKLCGEIVEMTKPQAAGVEEQQPAAPEEKKPEMSHAEQQNVTPPPPPPPPVPAPPKAVVSVGTEVRPLVAHDMETMWRMAVAFAKSRMLPKSYYDEKGVPEVNLPRNDPRYYELTMARKREVEDLAAAKAFTAMQLGAEVGLPAMQSIQSIAVVNGVATIWGDTQKALVERSGTAEYIRESYEGGEGPWNRDAQGNKTPNHAFKAVCRTRRFGRAEEVVGEFSVQDAIDAGLWGKDSPWKTHPKRMLLYKARAFALRDTYPDVLKGLTHSQEEMAGEEELLNVTPGRTPATDITPENGAAKLSSLLDKGMVNHAGTPTQGETKPLALPHQPGLPMPELKTIEKEAVSHGNAGAG